jgi:chromosome segregation ATPase
MKYFKPLFAMLAAVVLTAGCDKPTTTSQQIEKLKTDTKAASQDMNDYTYAQKAEYTEKMKGELAEINKELDQLSARIENSSDAVKAEARPKLESLREQAARLNLQLDEAKNATESTWESVKSGTRKAYEVLKEGFQQSRQWVSEKIAP